jgi:hypothetical protein
MLDRLDDLVFGSNNIVKLQRLAGRQPVKNLDHHGMGRLDAAVQRLAAVGRVIAVGIRKGRADSLQNCLRIERP